MLNEITKVILVVNFSIILTCNDLPSNSDNVTFKNKNNIGNDTQKDKSNIVLNKNII